MKTVMCVAASVLALVLTSGCAQTVVHSQARTAAMNLPRPSRVLVYNFAIAPEEVHPDQNVLSQVVNTATATSVPTRDAALGHEVVDSFADQLVSRIRAMGMNAERASATTPVSRDDVKIVGAFVDIDQGNQIRRLVIGLGAGASQVDAEVEVLQVSQNGVLQIAQFATHADSGEMPGGAGAVVTGGVSAGVAAAQGYRSGVEQMAGRSADKAAAYLSKLFAQQRWITAR